MIFPVVNTLISLVIIVFIVLGTKKILKGIK